MGQVKVLVLGGNGMLGYKVAEQLSDLNPIVPTRLEFDAELHDLKRFELGPNDWIINCIGAIPQKNPSIERLVELNTAFPYRLAHENPQRIIQIATDCVYSGTRGNYEESCQPDAKEPYGVTKRLGEVQGSNVMMLRTSIVGPELTSKRSLFEWVRNQPQNAIIEGFVNHHWNGVTTEAFAQVVKGVIVNDLFSPVPQHLVPADAVTKAELVELIARRLGRADIVVLPVETETGIDRTLRTSNKPRNELLWQKAGYSKPPTISEMIGAMGV
jgi:dTDP-4-dehydrorhamnose reductase